MNTVRSSSRPSGHYRARALLIDVSALVAATLLVALISPTPSPTGEVPAQPLIWALLFGAAFVALSFERGAYAPPVRMELVEVVRHVVSAAAIAAMLTMTLRVLTANDAYVAAETIRHLLFVMVFIGAARTALFWHEARARHRGLRGRNTVIVGAGKIGRQIADRLLSEPGLGLNPVAFIDAKPLPGMGGVSDGLPVLSPDSDIDHAVRSYGVQHAVMAFGWEGDHKLPDLARRLGRHRVEISVVPRLYELGGERSVVTWLGGVPLTQVQPEASQGWRMPVKYALDRVVAACALLVLAPLMGAIALGVRVSMGEPILFRQLRTGSNGRQFWMLKFRTMREATDGAEADAQWAAQLGLAVDPAGAVVAAAEDRRTPFGIFLRRFGLDELPQLINVLRGEMSLIGPRPERVTYAEHFSESIPRYTDRHRVKAGLTGWAQVNGLRGKTSLEDRVEWDNHYIEHWTPWMDLKILLLTLPRLRQDGEVATDAR